MKILKKLVLFLFVLVLILPVICFGFAHFYLSDMHDKDINTTSMDEFSHANKEGIENILIAGSDARPGEKRSRTDSMMILTIDKLHKDIKITSLARDTFVDIPGHGYSKLTHAYAFGGEDLLVQTIENNLGIDINHFVFINFESFIAIIDAIGGVEVDVTPNELNELNKFITETYKWNTNPNKGAIQYVEHTGIQKLNGYQALSFARIRHNDSAFNRDNRQRMIVSSILTQIKAKPVTSYPAIIKTVLPYVNTDMDAKEMLQTGVRVLMIGTDNLKQMQFPIVNPPGYSTGGILGRHGWVLRFNDSTLDDLKDFIFKDIEFKK